MIGGALPRWLRVLSRVCLRLYPRAFRAEHGGAYAEAVAHRWVRERGRALRTAAWLIADTVSAVPMAWRQVRGARRRGRASGWLGGLGADGRIGIRSLARRPGFSALVVATIGVGIGANTALFAALDRVVLNPMPFADGDRMMYLAFQDPVRGWQLTPPPEAVTRWRAGARTLEWIETYLPAAVRRTGNGGAELLAVTIVSAGLPRSLGIHALAGRFPDDTDLEPSDPPVIVLSESFWRREYGADPSAVGRTLLLNDTSFTIAGVWPGRARLELQRSPELWRFAAGNALREGSFGYVLALGRPGVAPTDVVSELAALAEGVDVPEGWRPSVNPPYGFLSDAYVQGLWLLFGGVLALLVASLVSAANLLLNRTISRAGELGVRAALGASRSAIARLFLTDSLLLVGLGMAVASVVAFWATRVLAALEPERLPVFRELAASGRVFAYASLLAILCVIVCVTVPMTQLRRHDVLRLLARDTGGRSAGRAGRGRDALVALQVALAVVLVTGSALTSRSLSRVLRIDTGVAVDEVVQFALNLPSAGYPTEESRLAFWRQVVESVTVLPGVQGVARLSNPLFNYTVSGGAPHLEGEEPVSAQGAITYTNGVSPGFFAASGITLIRGRDFADSDDERVTIVNRSFAESRGGDVLGRMLTFNDSVFYRIIGVAEDVTAGGVTAGTYRTQTYVPTHDMRDRYERFIIRTSGSTSELLTGIRARIAALDPSLPFSEMTTARDIVREHTARHRFLALLLALFGGLALLLAVTGVYGAVALNVSRRTREMGIRVALGADTRRVIHAVLATGLRPVLPGAAIGSLAALIAGARLQEGVLYDISKTDPLSIALGVALLLSTAAAACSIPARRASRIDPVDALRIE